MLSELRFADGVLFFPVTPFDDDDRVDAALAERLAGEGVDHGTGGVFAACGTGEFHALGLSDYETTVRAAVAGVAGRVPVVAGVGGPLGHARDVARAAERLGADGLLVMPPYLVQGPQPGLVRYIEAVASATALPLVVYHRANAQFSPASLRALLELPTVVGVKDGVGDIAFMQRFRLLADEVGRDLLLFNGLLTAEMSQSAYTAIGVPRYSSAVFAMAPEIATAYFRAERDGDAATRDRLLSGFYAPLVALRDETAGFAVSLIKAGLRLRGEAVGPVRPPLTDPTLEQLDRLEALLERGRVLAAGVAA